MIKDTQVANLIKAEKKRQKSVINLIPSENYVTDDVLEALGSLFNNKYAEGYPGKRYYGGNENTDKVERLCQKRALEAFGLSDKKWHVNVQPHSGSPANLAVYAGLLEPGDTIMGLALEQGGHLTHGHKVSMTSHWYNSVPYLLDPKTEKLNYDEIAKQIKKTKPKLIIAGFTAYPRKINWKKFREIADSVGAYLHVDMAHIAGLVAGGAHTSPYTHADTVTTTTHKTLRGPRGGMIFVKKDSRNLPAKIDKAIFPGLQGGPHINAIAAIAVALKDAKSSKFKTYAKKVVENSQILANELKKRGWRIVSGGTDNHLCLVDVWSRGITGSDAEKALEKAGIIVNKNTIPYDTRSPFNPSGIRIGSPAETTNGKGKKDFVKIAEKIDEVLKKIEPKTEE